ncbi:MAG: RNA 2',3'-cyclic phosphodiesterase [Fimbriimonadales bacterium]|jgi:2'-5' RNA ligase|nr:RNA 2',3'-cyclic phosphodiesterase [Armatimonadota bacterium]MCX7686591.1 RNA 2',3'-cyclic phosphodiesterase [Fimbriimonadales bacterium]CUU11404.1 2'-5' RNA ligase [Armatimonadetes bacterium GBS]CUU35938.1 2'-5' RNA ligase [Armatimonadetes bacterium DC]CUU38684.1 2'-5' RNA ligase [Armatimonadetes bacterium GXS]GBC89915.1 RNA 2',3'-cyclic phosphodiesterase [bacterium HR14]
MMRLFVAVLIPPDLMHRLAQEQARLKRHLPDRALRWVAPENFHITLLFLGEQPEERLSAIREAVQQASSEVAPFTIQVQGLGVFPNWNRPQVLWSGVEQGTAPLTQLAQRLQQNLLETPERKPFHAHITLARIKEGQSDLAKRLLMQVEPRKNHLFGAYEASHISLMLSELTPQGSRYTELERFELAHP